MRTRILLLMVAATAGVSGAAPGESSAGRRSRATRVLHLTRASYAGVRCPVANSIACDRISLAVWPAGHPRRLTATIGGRRIAMQPPPRGSGRGYWEGTLDHAGMLTAGPLHVTPDGGRFYWAGRHPRSFSLNLAARYQGRPGAHARVQIMLHPGWG